MSLELARSRLNC